MLNILGVKASNALAGRPVRHAYAGVNYISYYGTMNLDTDINF